MPSCRPGYFDPDWYQEVYADIAAAGASPRRHYQRHGRREGRLPCALYAARRERDLLGGFLADGRAALAALAGPQGASPAERAWAALACARAAARDGDWAGADTWLHLLDPDRDLTRGFCDPDHALLAIEAALMAGNTARATALWRRAARAFGTLPDLALAAANIAAAGPDGHGATWRRRLGLLYARAGLGGVIVRPGDGPAFDRLAPAWPAPRRRNGPLVSVIMPAYNAADTIAAALSSLSAQSWRSLEILVVDNGSTDATADTVRAAAAADPRIRLIDGSAEPGAYPARNIGLAAARGAFFTVLDADDWAHPVRIARQVLALIRDPARAASISHWVRTTPDMRFTRWWGESGLSYPNMSSLMFRIGLRDSLGYWDRARAGADSEYHSRVRAVHGPRAVAEVTPGLPLSFGRISPGSLTQASATSIASQYYGARRSYAQAGLRWHARMAADLPLPQHPARRPFDAPAALALSDPPAAAGPDGWLERSGIYDDRWYMQTYHDLRAADADGIAHYLSVGEAEGRDPGPGFSSSGYRMAHGVGNALALAHYLETGKKAGSEPLPVFAGALPGPGPGRHLMFFGHQARARVYGAERSLLDTLDRAIAAGLTPSVVLPHVLNAGYLAQLQARAHKVHVIPMGWLCGGVAPHPATLERLTALIRQSGATEVHQNTAVMDAPLLAARAAGVPSVVHVRELPASDPRLCLDLGLSAAALRTHLAGLATRFIANSKAVADWIGEPDRVTVLPNIVDPALAALPFAPGTPPRVALIGSLVAKKGIADFLAVARATPRRAARFVLIGEGGADLDRLGRLPANVSHAGYAETPAQALEAADIVMSLSHFAESFGRTVLEALSAGRPVICYGRGTPPDLIGTSGAGTVVPAGDTAAAARALAALLATPDRLAAASRAAHARGADLAAAAAAVPAAALFGPAG
jgi:glycosyltransferase involved in cell wall biosynthesis